MFTRPTPAKPIAIINSPIKYIVEYENLFLIFAKVIAPKALDTKAIAIIVPAKLPLALNSSISKKGICVGRIKNISI